MAFQDFVYLSKEDFIALKTNGTAVVNGVPLVYDPIYTQYHVPDDSEELLAAMQSAIDAQNVKLENFQEIINNLTPEANFPVGSRYTQFPDEPTPAERFGGVWQLDETAKDRFLVGAGNLYGLGTTGGSAEHTLTIDEMPSHKHQLESGVGLNWSNQGATTSPISFLPEISNGRNIESKAVGGGLPHNNMPPYLAVNIWKRIS